MSKTNLKICLEVPVSYGLIKSTLSPKPEISVTFCSPPKHWSCMRRGNNLLPFTAFKFKSTSGKKYTTENFRLQNHQRA